eukprot:TRINITY_DN6495_c0_g1_i1.p1 TRINITY_DN6495_c0_g1~~TRINITY_DN6495_c0_g1_i1.p1  ORF type:complete len:772 (-),score=109.98 TRINITY_DN6495_c0_g1_i1:74-2389(-)
MKRLKGCGHYSKLLRVVLCLVIIIYCLSYWLTSSKPPTPEMDPSLQTSKSIQDVLNQRTRAKSISCPLFESIGSTSLNVRWHRHNPRDQSEYYTLYVQLRIPQEAHYIAEQSSKTVMNYFGGSHLFNGSSYPVYSGSDNWKRLFSLLPGATYNFTLTVSNEKDIQISRCSKIVDTQALNNLIMNPSFEVLAPPLYPQVDYPSTNLWAAHWEPIMMPYQSIARGGRADNSRGWHVTSNQSPNKWGSSQFIFINQTFAQSSSNYTSGRKLDSFLFGGWSKSSQVSGDTDDGYSLYIDIKYSDSTYTHAKTLRFPTGTNDWNYQCLIIKPAKPIYSVTVYISFAEHTGSVWFDELELRMIPHTVAATQKGSANNKQCKMYDEPQTLELGCCKDKISINATNTPDPNDVSIISQMTIDRLPILSRIASLWKGPIAVSMFLIHPPNSEGISKDIERIHEFRDNDDMIRQNVDFHIVVTHDALYSFETLGIYPVNSLRNLAFRESRTLYSVALDIDFLPSEGARQKLLHWAPLFETEKVALVIPAFEIDEADGDTVPLSKSELVKSVEHGTARQVHLRKWSPAHGPTNYPKWYNLSITDNTYEISSQIYETTFTKDYEPYLMIRKGFPEWDERFAVYGYDKVSYSTELDRAGYIFKVVPDVFIIHTEHGVPVWRSKGDLVRVRVWFNFLGFIGETEMKYREWTEKEAQIEADNVKWEEHSERNWGVVAVGALVLLLCMAGVMWIAKKIKNARRRDLDHYRKRRGWRIEKRERGRKGR